MCGKGGFQRPSTSMGLAAKCPTGTLSPTDRDLESLRDSTCLHVSRSHEKCLTSTTARGDALEEGARGKHAALVVARTWLPWCASEGIFPRPKNLSRARSCGWGSWGEAAQHRGWMSGWEREPLPGSSTEGVRESLRAAGPFFDPESRFLDPAHHLSRIMYKSNHRGRRICRCQIVRSVSGAGRESTSVWFFTAHAARVLAAPRGGKSLGRLS